MSLQLRLDRRIRRVDAGAVADATVVRVGTLRAQIGWSGRATAAAVTGLSLPLGVERRGTSRSVPWSRPGDVLRRALFVRARTEDRHEEERPMDEHEALESFHRPAAYPAEQIGHALGLAAGGAGAVGPITTVGDRTVIPLTETVFSGGFGGGGGGGLAEATNVGAGSGGGGGGGGRSRTIAVAVIGPDGVEVRPVVDYTGIALAAFTTVVALMARRIFRRR